MRFGHFDDETREYVIERPNTPLPWINYLGQNDFIALISNTGGGYCFHRDARLRRLLRYRYNNVPSDVGGRCLYLRLGDGDYWSPTWQPVRKPLLAFTCRHGLGYTRISSHYRGISAEMTYLVPLNQTLEAWRVRLSNRTAAPADVQLFALVEFCLWDAWDDQTNFQRNLNIGEVEVDAANRVIYHKTEYRERRDHFAYFACSAPTAGFDTQREAFLGPYRGLHEPLAVQEGRCRNSVAHGWSPVGVHQVRLPLAPGEEREIIFVLGYAENADTFGRAQHRARAARHCPAHDHGRVRRRAGRPARLLGRPAERFPGAGARPACHAHGQHVEPLPGHGHVQRVAQRLPV
jgi:cellobiose phosphorylase